MNEKYYVQVGKVVKLNKDGKNIIFGKLFARRCTECGGKLALTSYIDGDKVVCFNDQQHKSGYSIFMDEPNYEDGPKLVSSD